MSFRDILSYTHDAPSPIGVLLTNVGSPAAPTGGALRGGEFHYIPALNGRPDHLAAPADVIMVNLGGWPAAEGSAAPAEVWSPT